MTDRKPSVHGRQIVASKHSGASSLSFSDERWSRIAGALPHPPINPAQLRREIISCCNLLLTNVRAAERGRVSAQAITRGGGKQPAPLERLISQLNEAKETWVGISDMHDDHLGVLSDLGELLTAAVADAERRLSVLRSSKRKPVVLKAPFISSLAKCLRKHGFKPTATGQIYGGAEPTWFQRFVQTLNDQLLGNNGWGAPGAYSENALYADVAKAMIGYKKPG